MLSVARHSRYASPSCEIVQFVCVFYQLKGACPTDTNSTHQSPRNTDPAYIAATEQFRTVAHGREVGLPALLKPWSRVTPLARVPVILLSPVCVYRPKIIYFVSLSKYNFLFSLGSVTGSQPLYKFKQLL